MSFVNNVLSELSYQGKSQSDLADSIGIKKSTISMWITRDSVPAADVAQKVADYLNVPLRYLLTGEGKEKPESPLLAYDASLTDGDIGELEEIIGSWSRIDARGKGNVMDTVRREKRRARCRLERTPSGCVVLHPVFVV